MEKIKIYLDNCCYGRPFDNQNDIEIFIETQAKIFIQSLVKLNVIDLIYSSMVVKELNDYPFEENRKSIFEFIEGSAKFFLEVDNIETIAALTKAVMKTGIRLKDATHTACAIFAKCDYLITTDKRLLKYNDNRIKIISPIDFVKIWRDIND